MPVEGMSTPAGPRLHAAAPGGAKPAASSLLARHPGATMWYAVDAYHAMHVEKYVMDRRYKFTP